MREPRRATGQLLIDPLLPWKVRTFGFICTGLDIRQHSRALTQAVSDMASTRSSAGPGEGLRFARAVSRCARRRFVPLPNSRSTLAPEAIRNFIVSDTQSEEDVLNVVRLAEVCGVSCSASGRDRA